MASGYPDWGVVSLAPFSFDFDSSELAIKLGFPGIFINSGKVYEHYIFNIGYEDWTVTADPIAGTVTHINSIKNSSFGVIKIAPSSNEPYEVYLDYTQPRVSLSNVGISVYVWLRDDIHSFDIDINDFDGTNQSIYGIRYVKGSNLIQVLDNTLTYQTVSTGEHILTDDNRHFVLMKLVFSPVNSTYQWIQINDATIDISSYTPNISSFPILDERKTTLTIRGADNADTFAYISSVVWSRIEPNQP